jgi:plasmid stabilization system protein ParE
MNHRVILSPDAKADFSAIVLWYLRTDPKLAFRCSLEILDTLRRIKQFPYASPLRYGSLRCAVLKDFPYVIYYSVNKIKVSVRAIIHQRRVGGLRADRSNGHGE